MSDESEVVAPEPTGPGDDEPASALAAESDAEPASAELAGAAPAARWVRVLPRPLRRWPRITVLGAGVLAVAAVAAVVLVAVRPGPPQPAYSSLPAPCDLVRAAVLAKFLPGATGTPETIPTDKTIKAGSCKWSSTTGGDDRTLLAEVFIIRSAPPVSLAQEFYRNTLSSLDCHCRGVTVTTTSVTGVGDQAEGLFISAGPDVILSKTPGAAFPGANLVVQSSNAIIGLDLDTSAAATGTSLTVPDHAAQLADMVSVARGILAALAVPAAVPRSAAAPASAEPDYAAKPDPCRLISAATLGRYAPGVNVFPGPSPSTPADTGQLSSCSWGSDSIFILLNLTTFPDAASARQGFDVDAGTAGTGGATTVTGSRWLADLGGAAFAVFKSQSGENGVEVFVWSGNAELDYWFAGKGAGPSLPGPATLLAGGVAMARDGLFALARPALSGFPEEPLYVSPHDACTLIKTATLARYAPGASSAKLPQPNAPGGPQTAFCAWEAQTGSIFLSVTTYSGPDSALSGYQFDVQSARKGETDTKVIRTQPVNGLGQQAIALFTTVMGNSPDVDVYVLSDNAEIQVSYSNVPFSTPLSRSAMLAADTAMTRDVLADLHRR